jgi:predicted metal-dependent phosphoesterase TrpH
LLSSADYRGERLFMVERQPIDLHAHSTASDGRLTPTRLVERAAECGVRVLALTDHDTVAGLVEAGSAARRLDVTLVPALEMSVQWARRTLHVVALDVDPAAPALERALSRLAAARLDRARRIARRLRGAGVADALDGASRMAGGALPGRMHFARYLVDCGAVDSPQAAFRKYLGRGQPAAVRSDWLPLAEGVAAIRAAGGIPVLAHPTRYGFTRTWLRDACRAFREAGGTGIEVVTGGDGPGDRGLAAALARREGLLASAGSDFHDPDFRWRELGRLARLPADLTPVWQGRTWAVS